MEYAMVDATIVGTARAQKRDSEPSHRFDAVGARPLIKGVGFGALLASKAFGSNDIMADLNERGAKIAMRECKTDCSFEAMICLAAAVINLR